MSTVYVRFDLGSGADRRSAALERLLARAAAVVEVSDWRADAWARLGGGAMPAVAPAIQAASFDRTHPAAAATGSIFLATPVHYVAQMSSVRMGDGLAPLAPAEALATAADFNRIWNEGRVQLVAAPSGHLLCTFSRAIEAATRDPATARGELIEEYLPCGGDAKALRLLMSEIEMWLFDAPLNRARRARGEVEISGLWLWGGGARVPDAAAAEFPGWSAGGDVFFDALAATLASTPDPRLLERSGVVVVSGRPEDAAWREFENRWMPQLLASLKAGADRWLDVSAGARRFSMDARWRRRFWRRSRPWWEYFE